MKSGYFAVLPMEVRHDSHLSDKSKLLYAEISAASNAYGICEDDNAYFATCLKCEPRTITRCLAQLVDNGHVIRLIEEGRSVWKRRKLKIVYKGMPIPLDQRLKVVTEVNMEAVVEFAGKLMSLWEMRLQMEIPEKASFVPVIKQRLDEFSEEEILKATEKRIEFLHQAGDQVSTDFNSFISDSDIVKKWLTSK